MNSGFYSSYVGLASRMQALDVLANNLANVNTSGFKAQHEFYRAFQTGPQGSRVTPAGMAINDFGVLGGARVDMQAGSFQTTGNDTDVALEGDGFLAVQTKAGVRYTRAGNFRLDAQRHLVTAAGEPVLGEQGPVQLPAGKISISEDGTISVDSAIVTRLKVVEFVPGTALTPEGSTNLNVPSGAVKAATATRVRQGSLESSNCDPVRSSVQLILLQRTAQMMEKAMAMFHNDFNKVAAEQLARV
jgi:flagellar basal-body rod protein FlgF/flagellar basal-body rod protein FlgG